MDIMWFKRDLRIHDNEALVKATESKNFIPLYIIEPELWQQDDLSYRQYIFLTECLKELNEELTKIGQPLIIKTGNVIEIFNNINKVIKINTIYSTQETWNDWTYQRDIKVEKWLNENNINWHQTIGHGVFRKLKNRKNWPSKWYNHVGSKILEAPKTINKIDSKLNIKSNIIPTYKELYLCHDNISYGIKGGRQNALKLLSSFLRKRGEKYQLEISSPVTAYKSCSRISPHISFGVISIKEVYQITKNRISEIYMAQNPEERHWMRALIAFTNRLRQHCHFIQKLEDQPEIEYNNMHSAYDNIRNTEINLTYLNAWKLGLTGYPIVDACMRALIKTGWLNFRMRAMLICFASNNLWLNWKVTSKYLASLFVDYEPGIHYSQIQMQSGTTGINSIRIYNPVKQSIDQDPEGKFIKRWIPELANMPKEYIHSPWKMPNLMNGYPSPIVNEKETRKFAINSLYTIRGGSSHREESEKIVLKHTSRKPSRRNIIKKSKAPNNSNKYQNLRLF